MRTDPILLAVLADRLAGAVREMGRSLLRTGSSGMLARESGFSCAVTTEANDLVATTSASPGQLFGAQLMSESLTELHPDLADGDAYLHNDPYLGNSHPADHTVLVPIFHDGEHVFTALAKAHQADAGAADPFSGQLHTSDVYHDGALIFPCVRIQRDRADVDDMVRLCRARIRRPDRWYADYRGLVAAARIGETRLTELCSRYGVRVVRDFLADWFDYSETRMAHAVERLPAGTVTGYGAHDPVDGVLPDGIPLNVTVTADPADARITVDLRDNIDCVPAGLNESEARTVSSTVAAVFASLGPGIPANSGSFRRVRVLLRDNCIIGRPAFPHSVSAATLADRLAVTTERTIADGWDGFGAGEAATGLGPGYAVVTGVDRRRGHEPVTDQLHLGSRSSAATSTTDGLVTGGPTARDSVELVELRLPIRVEEVRVRQDSEGAGRRRGAPGLTVRYGPKWDELTASYTTDDVSFPPHGAQGGGAAARTVPFRSDRDRTDETEIAPIGRVELAPGELIGQHHAGGGGYGDPRTREPERVLDDVLAGIVSIDRAIEIYRVAFAGTGVRGTLVVDEAATARLRGAPNPV
ncbi:hydantoinase B/oxoprolinase family protein [Pseudonocardia spinosispora]|uniref:hydantoinase B/oxoprolinase family protein n=1 Tax=Pseudonocardia spinosispora TaxID=103441 RepID=UPI00042A6F6B|nr:hydantoinase B/oxoprolinase family protein [Pseudonocardia spinosispora]